MKIPEFNIRSFYVISKVELFFFDNEYGFMLPINFDFVRSMIEYIENKYPEYCGHRMTLEQIELFNGRSAINLKTKTVIGVDQCYFEPESIRYNIK